MPSKIPPTKNPALRVYRKVKRVLRDLRRERLRNRFALTAPSPAANRDLPYSPHILVCHRDALLAVCSAKSLNLAMGEALPWVFHDDGSMTPEDDALIQRQFPGCRLVKRREADLFFENARTAHSQFHEMRQKHVLLLKLSDLGAFASRERILYVDSDILFFEKPAFLAEKLRDPASGSFFNRDIDTAYIASPQVLKELTGIEPPPRINSGLSILNRADLTVEKVAALLSQLDVRKRTDWSHYNHLIEQTVVALLTCSSPAGARLLPESYDVCFDRPIAGAVSRHYVGVIRHLFEIEGLDHLLNRLAFEERWREFAGAPKT